MANSRKTRESLLFLLLSLLILGRSIRRILFPQIINEDTRIFLPDAINLGAASLLEPYAGYFHTLPRMIALLAVQFDALYWPLTLTLACVALFALMCWRLTFDDMEEVFGKKSTRLMIACAFVMMSGVKECLGNPTNLHWILALYVVILFFRSKATRIKIWEFPFVFLAASSAGELVAFFPLFAYRIWRDRERSDFFIAVNIVFFSALNFVFKESGPPILWENLQRLPMLLTYGSMNQSWLIPLIGHDLSFFLASKAAWAYWPLGLATGFFIIKEIYSKRHFHLALGYLCLLGFMMLVGIAREELVHLFDKMARPASDSEQRYALIPSALAFLLMAAIILRSRFQRFLPAYLIVFVLIRLGEFSLPPHSPKGKSWSERVSHARSTQEGETVEVPAWPPDQKITIPRQ